MVIRNHGSVTEPPSDALVLFGATGDLAYKQIFPALQSMIRRGHLDMPIIGVAKSGWGLDDLKKRAHDSLSEHGGVDKDAFAKLTSLLGYIDGDYADPATFDALRTALDGSAHPVHYLAIPEHPYYQRRFGWRPEDVPQATRIGRETVSLPLSPKLSEDDVQDVIAAVRASLGLH